MSNKDEPKIDGLDESITGQPKVDKDKPDKEKKWDPLDYRIVTLDVGGTIFKTYVNVLTRYSGYFRALLDKNVEEQIFVDRDPDLFKQILAYMRHSDYKFKQ